MIKKVAGNYYVHCSNLEELENELTGFDGTNQKLIYLQSFQKHKKFLWVCIQVQKPMPQTTLKKK